MSDAILSKSQIIASFVAVMCAVMVSQRKLDVSNLFGLWPFKCKQGLHMSSHYRLLPLCVHELCVFHKQKIKESQKKICITENKGITRLTPRLDSGLYKKNPPANPPTNPLSLSGSSDLKQYITPVRCPKLNKCSSS